MVKHLFAGLLAALMGCAVAQADLVYNVENISVFDVGAGTSHTLGGTTADDNNFVPTDHLTLSSYTVGGTTYSSSLVSAINSNTPIAANTAGRYLQPKGYAAANLANPFFPDAITGTSLLGTDNVVPYLTEGSNGLDFSTALNLRPTVDTAATITFGITFTSDPTTAGVAAFFAGDSAGNQTDDSWTFYDAMGSPVTNTIVIGESAWKAFDKIDLDPILANGNVQTLAIQNLSFSAWGLESTDFLAGKDWTDIASATLRVPAIGDEPKTDYTFIGINNTIATSPDAVIAIPEPSTLTLFGLGLAGLAFRRRR